MTVRVLDPDKSAKDACVVHLESLLERAKAGEILSVVVVLDDGENVTSEWAGPTNTMRRSGMLVTALLQHHLAMTEPRE